MTDSIGDSHGRRALRASILQVAAQVAVVPVGLAVLVYLTRRLGPELYGQYATVITVLAWIEFALCSFLVRPTIKEVANASDPRTASAALVRLAVALGMLATAGLCLGAPLVARLVGDPSLGPPLALASIDIVFFVAASSYIAAIAGMGRFERRSLAAAVRWPVRLLLAIIFIEVGWGLTGAVAAVIGASVVEFLVCFACCPLPLWSPPARFSHTPSQWLWSDALPLCGASMTLRVLDGGDLLMLRVLGADAAGIGAYALAMNLAMLPGICAAAVGPVLMTTTVQVRLTGRLTDVARFSSAVFEFLSWLMVPAIAVCFASPTILVYCFGAPFAGAANLFQILWWAGLARMVVSIAGVMLAAAGRSSAAWRASAPMVPLALLGYCLVIPQAGARGAAWVTCVVSLIGAGLSIRALARLLDVRFPRYPLAGVLATAALVLALTRIWPLTNVLAAFAYVFGAVVASLALVWLTSKRLAGSELADMTPAAVAVEEIT